MNRNARNRFFRPSIEVLESRWNPSITPIDINPDVAGNDSVRILGTSGVDRVIISDNPVSDTVTYQHDVGNNGSIDFALTTSVFDFGADVDLGAGNDILIYNVLSDYVGSSKRLNVFLGTGNDRVNFNMDGFDISGGADWFIEIYDASVSGGSDDVFLNFASPTSQATDTNIANAAVSVVVELGAGQDDAIVNFDGNIGDGAGENDTVVDLAISLGTQNDRFFGQFDLGFFDIFNDGELELAVNGGANNDLIRLQRHPSFAGSGPATIDGVLDVDLHGGYGLDTIDVAFARVGTQDAFDSVSLGSVRLRVNGDDGSDNIQVRLSNSSAAILNYDVIVRGGTGSDSMGLSIISQAGSTVTFSAIGSALLDGGFGADIFLFAMGNVQRRSI